MQTETAEQRRQPGRSRRGETRGTQPRAVVSSTRSSEEEIARLKEIITVMHQKEKQAGDRGGGAGKGVGDEEEEERERERGKDRSRGGRRRRTASEGGGGSEESGRLRWRVSQLEKEKLELTSSHNQELCRLQAELTRLMSSVERGEAQRVELQYQLTVSQRDAERAAELRRDKHALTERAAELQQTVQELQKALDITRRAREEDQHALQQDIEERDKLIQSFSSENQRLHRLLQDQEEALEEAERRMAEVQKEREKEVEVNRRQANELKYLTEREERSRREKEVSDQRVESLQSNIEAERAAHLESKFNSEIIQLRVRDLEAAVAVERSGQQEAQCSLELLRAQFREVEKAYSLERERSSSTEHAQERLQKEFEQCKSDLSVALETERKTTSDLTERLKEEERRHADTHSLLEQANKRQSDTEGMFMSCMKQIRAALQQHSSTGCTPAAKDHGNKSLSVVVLQLLKTTLGTYQHRLEETDKQLQDLLFASERLQEENQALRQLTSQQSGQIEKSQQASITLQEEVTRLRQESSDWSTQSRSLQAELEREKEEREREKEEMEREKEREKEEMEREKEREKEEMEREKEREKEEMEREKEEKAAEVQEMSDLYQEESKVRLSFLYCLYQRLLAGCVLLDQPQSILGNFTWEELCDVINEQVDQLTSDLRKANSKIAHLQSVCEKKSVCVRELQLSQECVLSRLEESVRRREEAWSSQHTHTVTQLQKELQLCRSQGDSLRDHVSSLTSDLSRGRRESAAFLSACALLAGAMAHAHQRLRTLSEQKTLLSRRLAEREELEEEVRRLAGALGPEEGDEEKEEKEGRGRRRRAVRRWRRSVCVVLAVRRWRAFANKTTVLFRLERSDGPAVCVCVCGNEATATQKGQDVPTNKDDGGDEGRDGVCTRWLHSRRLSSAILSSMSDLPGALTHSGSSPPAVMSAARSALSRLLDHLLNQSDGASGSVDEDSLTGRLKLGLNRLTPPWPDMKVLVSSLQQHFLLFSQRLHSAEVERRSLRLEVANLKRAGRRERVVPAERFHSVCVELRQALSREQEAQTIIQEQTSQLHTLQLQVNTHSTEQTDTQHTLSQTAQSLSEARQEVSRKERSLRTLGKYLSGLQRQRRQLEERLQQAEDELRDAARRKDCLIRIINAAERSYKEVRESLVQSRHSLSDQPHPLPLPREHVETNGAESIMGAPEVAACQALLSTFSQLYHTCSSRIIWLEQEVSAHRSHVTALRSELQDACLRDNLAYVPVDELPETFSCADVQAPQHVPFSDLLKVPPVSLSTAPSQTNPAPSVPPSKPTRTKTKEKKAMKKNRGRTKT
ncbi:hypothetical protein PAMA_013590 [Pampus argenteus]